MKTDEYDFFLPEGFIAERPSPERDSSRLLVLHKKNGSMEHKIFGDLHEYLDAGDMLILNNSKVLPARLTGLKPTGGKLEILLVSKISETSWNILSQGNFSGNLMVSEGLNIRITDGKRADFENSHTMSRIINEFGSMPLPPYIKRSPDEDDKKRYQTIYAGAEGSIAAPTAGLHFTTELLYTLSEKNVKIRFVTLHVGTGTFRPVKAEDIEDHIMDEESFEIDCNLISEIEQVKKTGSRVITVGTTTTRTLEGYLSNKCSVFSANGKIKGATDLFIYEGHRFMAADALITNFHLPRSTPLMLASAFAGRAKLLNAYSSAVTLGYRFFSYGDAMLVL